MSTIQRHTENLRNELLTWNRALKVADNLSNEWLKSLPAAAVNLPTETAILILAAAGFCIVHKDHMDDVIACVEIAAGQDHETAEEAEKLDALIGYLKSQRMFAD